MGLHELELCGGQLRLRLLDARPRAAGRRLLDRHLGLLGLGVGDQGLSLFDAALGLLDRQGAAARLRLGPFRVALRLGEPPPCGVERGDRRAVGGAGCVELLLGDEAPGGQPRGAVQIEARPVGRRLGDGYVGLRRGRGGGTAVRAGLGLVLLRAGDVDGDARGGQRGPRLLDPALGALAGERDLGVRPACSAVAIATAARAWATRIWKSRGSISTRS